MTSTPNGGRRSGYGACRRDPLAPAAPPAARDCDFAVSSCCSRSSATRSVQALCARGADHKFGASLRCAACGHDPSAGAAPPTLRDCHLLTPPRIVQVADARQDQAQLMGRREREGGRPKGRRVGARRRDGPPISLPTAPRDSRDFACAGTRRVQAPLCPVRHLGRKAVEASHDFEYPRLVPSLPLEPSNPRRQQRRRCGRRQVRSAAAVAAAAAAAAAAAGWRSSSSSAAKVAAASAEQQQQQLQRHHHHQRQRRRETPDAIACCRRRTRVHVHVCCCQYMYICVCGLCVYSRVCTLSVTCEKTLFQFISSRDVITARQAT